jgi:hypothetical protein
MGALSPKAEGVGKSILPMKRKPQTMNSTKAEISIQLIQSAREEGLGSRHVIN